MVISVSIIVFVDLLTTDFLNVAGAINSPMSMSPQLCQFCTSTSRVEAEEKKGKNECETGRLVILTIL